MVKGKILAVRQLEDRQLQAWADLAARAVQPNPLFEPGCLVPASRHLVNGAAISLVVAEHQGRYLGCFPVQAQRSWRALRRPVLVTQVRRMQYDGTPLVDPEGGAGALSAMLEALEASAKGGGPGLVVLDWLDHGVVAAQLGQACEGLGIAQRTYTRWERPVLRRRPEGDYRSLHSRKFLKNVERLRRRLAEAEGGEVALVDRSDDPAGVEVLVGLEASGYKAHTGVAMASHPGEVAWFTEMCDRFRAAGRLHLHTLEVGARAIAAQLALRAGEGLFLLKVAYDEEFAPYTPGIQLHLDGIDHLFATTDAAWIDTCTYGGNATAERMYPDRQSVSAVVLATGGWVDRGALWGVSRARALAGRDAHGEEARAPRASRAFKAAAPEGRKAVTEVATAKRSGSSSG